MSRNVKFHINDADTGKGIPNITVYMGSRTRTTNSDGHADFENTGAGTNAISLDERSIYTAGYDVAYYKNYYTNRTITISDGTSAMSHTMSLKKIAAPTSTSTSTSTTGYPPSPTIPKNVLIGIGVTIGIIIVVVIPLIIIIRRKAKK